MKVERARLLVSPAGREALAALDPGLGELTPTALASRLRRTLPADLAAAVAEQVDLRRRAAPKLGAERDSWLLSADGLEMMTHPLVAARRARRMARLGRTVIDLTCGLGGDLGAAVEGGARAFAIDRDAAHARLAAANVPRAEVAVGDAACPPFDLAPAAVLLDPSRRRAGGRTFDPAAFSPAWDVTVALAGAAAAAAIKAPPGIDLRAVPGAAEVEFVELGRDLRECSIYLGEGAEPGLRRALLLPAETSLDSRAPEGPDTLAPGPLAYIFDPRSCVTRAGLVRHLAFRVGARLMDPRVAYLAADAPAADPLADCFAVLEVIPFSLKRVRARLREAGWRPQEVRKRAFPVEVELLERVPGQEGGDPVTLLCTTVGTERLVIVARPWRP